jgi:hypothetical protein
LPTTSTPATLGDLSTKATGGYRVLWLGNSRVLPLQGWSVEPGLAAATTTDGLPDGETLFSSPTTGAFGPFLDEIRQAVTGRSVRLGMLLAPASVSTVVVMTSDAPELGGAQTSTTVDVPAGVISSLERQSDLALSAHTAGVYVFTNLLFHPIVASRSGDLAPTVLPTDPAASAGWTTTAFPFPFDQRQGQLSSGPTAVALAPSGDFTLTANGQALAKTDLFGWAAQYEFPGGVAQLRLSAFPFNGLLALATLILWLAALASLSGVASRRTPRHSRGGGE